MDSDSRAGKSITLAIAEERRPATQIGSDIDYAQVTRGIRMLLIGVIGLVAILVVLSLFVKVEEVARARGEFVPVQRVQVIQTPEGGAMEAVLVRNDEAVQKGQPIAKFRAADLVSALQRAEVRIAYLEIQIERLSAFASGRPTRFARFQDRYASMVREAEELNVELVRQRERNLEQADRQIDEERSALTAAQSEIPAAKSSLNATKELLERMRGGVSKGVIAPNRLAQVEEQAAQSERIYTQLVASLDQHAARIKSLEAERGVIMAKAASDALSQRSEFMGELSELEATQKAYQSRSFDIEVRAPIAGIIQKISETPIGTVIPAGGTVCEIVPTEGGVLMQARVSSHDIGFVQVGQKVDVKSDAFDYGRFGSITGRLARIAPSSALSDNGQMPYFLVEVDLDQPYVGTNKTHIVTPGMTGEAAILTGEKSIFQYLLKPIYLAADTALRER